MHREAEEAMPDRQGVHTSSPACLHSLPLHYPLPLPPPLPQEQQQQQQLLLQVGLSLEEADTAWDHTGSSWTDR